MTDIASTIQCSLKPMMSCHISTERPNEAPNEISTVPTMVTAARMNPELLMVETDHDMRNPADMLVMPDRPFDRPCRTLSVDEIADRRWNPAGWFDSLSTLAPRR